MKAYKDCMLIIFGPTFLILFVCSLTNSKFWAGKSLRNTGLKSELCFVLVHKWLYTNLNNLYTLSPFCHSETTVSIRLSHIVSQKCDTPFCLVCDVIHKWSFKLISDFVGDTMSIWTQTLHVDLDYLTTWRREHSGSEGFCSNWSVRRNFH